jgi:hypothetical protein
MRWSKTAHRTPPVADSAAGGGSITTRHNGLDRSVRSKTVLARADKRADSTSPSPLSLSTVSGGVVGVAIQPSVSPEERVTMRAVSISSAAIRRSR